MASLTDYFSDDRTVVIDDSFQTVIKMVLDKSGFKRAKAELLGKELLCSQMAITLEGCVIETKEYHPAEIAYDSSLLKQVLLQFSAIIDRIDLLTDKMIEEDDNESLSNEISELKMLRDKWFSSILDGYENKFSETGERKYYYIKEIAVEFENGANNLNEAVERFSKRIDEVNRMIKHNKEIRRILKTQRTEKEKQYSELKNETEIIIAKNRYGDIGTINGIFNRGKLKFDFE